MKHLVLAAVLLAGAAQAQEMSELNRWRLEATFADQPVWTLIAVTHGGNVAQTGGFKTRLMCEQAKSLALEGLTLEEAEAARVARTEAIQRDIANGCKNTGALNKACPGYYVINSQPIRVHIPGDIKFARCMQER